LIVLSSRTYIYKDFSSKNCAMISLEVLAFLGPVLATPVVLLTALLEVRLDDRAERRRAS
jgi:hypothetical protein